MEAMKRQNLFPIRSSPNRPELKTWSHCLRTSYLRVLGLLQIDMGLSFARHSQQRTWNRMKTHVMRANRSAIPWLRGTRRGRERDWKNELHLWVQSAHNRLSLPEPLPTTWGIASAPHKKFHGSSVSHKRSTMKDTHIYMCIIWFGRPKNSKHLSKTYHTSSVKNGHGKPSQNRGGFCFIFSFFFPLSLFFFFSLSLSPYLCFFVFVPCFSLSTAVSWHLETPKPAHQISLQNIYIYIYTHAQELIGCPP